MTPWRPAIWGWVFGCLLAAFVSVAAGAPLRIERLGGVISLVTDPPSTGGTLFVFGASRLELLGTDPLALRQWVVPAGAGLGFEPPGIDGAEPAAFFTAGLWVGETPGLLPLPAGEYAIGSPGSQPGRLSTEGPITRVKLTRTVYMGAHEVTQAQYLAVMGTNPSYFTGNRQRPVERVRWTDARDFCARLTRLQREGGILPSGWEYRLPTESEWEVACRAGTSTAFSSGESLLVGMENFDGRYPYLEGVGTSHNPAANVFWRPLPVGSYRANAWGFHDLHGNVREWCVDRWSEELMGGTVVDPAGPPEGSGRVVRGGGWYSPATGCRSAFRSHLPESYSGNEVGFRVVLGPRWRAE